MRLYKTVTVIDKEVTEIICNICGQKVDKDLYGNFFDYIHLEKTWGYNSKWDMESHSFDICQNCYEKIMKNARIRPF